MTGILHLVLGGNRGVRYIPREFGRIVSAGISWEGCNPDDIKILVQGPRAEHYWETWQDVLENATFVDSKGNRWNLWQDGDLFMYCETLMDDEEYENFFGGPRNQL